MNTVADTGCVTAIILLALAVMAGFIYRECNQADDPRYDGVNGQP